MVVVGVLLLQNAVYYNVLILKGLVHLLAPYTLLNSVVPDVLTSVGAELSMSTQPMYWPRDLKSPLFSLISVQGFRDKP